MSCIARRAHPDRVSFRLVKEGKEGKYIWTEFKCPNVVSEGSSVCTDCYKKLPKHKYQANPKCDHGIVGGPYPSDSKLYGSPFYLKQLKEGFTIMEADEKRAKEAIAKALSEMPRKKIVAETVDAVVAAMPPTPTVETIKAPKKPRVYKTKSIIPDVAVTATVNSEPRVSVAPQMLESMAAPVIASEVIMVKVKKIRCQGKDYYLDSSSGKLYDVTKAGVGSYKGRYNNESEQLVDYPDSDAE
jgi:hypothetical protein